MSRLSQIRKAKQETANKISRDLDSGGRQEDKRFWKLTRDKSGSGSATIRFLPPTGNDELPWVKVYHNAFQGPSGKWFINNCPTTIGLPSPVQEHVSALYATKDEDDKKLAGLRKRKLQFISKILVIKDNAAPENDGKVFLFKYGKSIHDMIATKMRPEFEDQESVEVWDIDNGANFKLRVKNKDKYPTYENSEFDSVSPLCGGDEDKIEALLEQAEAFSLSEFIQPDQFKSYDQLKKEMDAVLTGAPIRSAAQQAEQDMETPPQKQRTVEAEKISSATRAPSVPVRVTDIDGGGEDDQESMDYFKKLLSDS